MSDSHCSRNLRCRCSYCRAQQWWRKWLWNAMCHVRHFERKQTCWTTYLLGQNSKSEDTSNSTWIQHPEIMMYLRYQQKIWWPILQNLKLKDLLSRKCLYLLQLKQARKAKIGASRLAQNISEAHDEKILVLDFGRKVRYLYFCTYSITFPSFWSSFSWRPDLQISTWL